ncbi:MAG: HigA family addiction module antidote protein [Alphaproteobacteria bacterium]|nr:HigA family addiction module antidote protein [Alphaproteobacteria bacterium]
MSRHPGRILMDDFLVPLGLNASQLARGIGVSRSTVSRLIAGEHPLTPTMAARLGAYFQVPARWFLLMQAEHDAAVVEGDAGLTAGVTPMPPDPDVLLTPKGVMRLPPASSESAEPEPLSLPVRTSRPWPGAQSSQDRRAVRQVEYACGSVALVGDPP